MSSSTLRMATNQFFVHLSIAETLLCLASESMRLVKRRE